MSKDLIDQMRKSVDALKGAESESRANLDAVNQQLKSAFEVFGTTLVEQVRRVSGETDKNISTLSNQLIGVVQELTQFMHRTRRQ
jgi:signal transduction histidine kinase